LAIETNGKSRKISKSSLENIQRFLLAPGPRTGTETEQGL
jgi:hypothetical protein